MRCVDIRPTHNMKSPLFILQQTLFILQQTRALPQTSIPTLQDMRLVWKNCFTYNAKDSPVGKLGKLGEREWEQRWAASGLSSSDARARRNNAGIAAAKYEPALGPPSKRASGAALSGGRRRVSNARCCLKAASIMLGCDRGVPATFSWGVCIMWGLPCELISGAALFDGHRSPSHVGWLAACIVLLTRSSNQLRLVWWASQGWGQLLRPTLPLGLLPLPAVTAPSVSAQRPAIISKLPAPT